MSAFAIYTGAAVKPGLAVINITVDGVEYIAEAPCGTAATDGAWVCSAVYQIGTTGRRVKFAAGLHAPGESGENLAGLTYA